MIPGQPGADLVDMEAARRHTLARPATQNYEAESPSARAARRVHATRGQLASVEKYSRAAEGGAAF